MFLRSTVRNPANSAFKLYTPGGRARMTYKPASFVGTDLVAFVDGLMSVIVTPGTTAAVGSLTTPLISPEGACAPSGTTKRIAKSNAAADDRIVDLPVKWSYIARLCWMK